MLRDIIWHLIKMKNIDQLIRSWTTSLHKVDLLWVCLYRGGSIFKIIQQFNLLLCIWCVESSSKWSQRCWLRGKSQSNNSTFLWCPRHEYRDTIRGRFSAWYKEYNGGFNTFPERKQCAFYHEHLPHRLCSPKEMGPWIGFLITKRISPLLTTKA